MKWPRRDLLKAAKKQQSPSQESYAPRQSDLVGSEAMIMVTPDTDASPIGNFGPGLHQSSSQAPNSPLFGERSSGSYLEPMRIDPDYTIPLPGNSGTRLAFPGGSACSSLEAQKSTVSLLCKTFTSLGASNFTFVCIRHDFLKTRSSNVPGAWWQRLHLVISGHFLKPSHGGTAVTRVAGL